jgi:hypothetical protein
LTGVKINGLIINMESNVEVIGRRFGVLYGTFFIVLGIVTALVTYKYIFPIGSIMLVLSGAILIFWKKWNYDAYVKMTDEDI